jgi:hypothetical protein
MGRKRRPRKRDAGPGAGSSPPPAATTDRAVSAPRSYRPGPFALFAGMSLGLLVMLGAWWWSAHPLPTRLGGGGPSVPLAATYVGHRVCGQCHAQVEQRWRGSHHDLAMQPPTDASVAGNFDNARFTYAGVTSTFSRRDGKFVVRTDGPDGRLADYEVKYTFGISPLQQYLVELPGGRLQALGIAWDTRRRARRAAHAARSSTPAGSPRSSPAAPRRSSSSSGSRPKPRADRGRHQPLRAGSAESDLLTRMRRSSSSRSSCLRQSSRGVAPRPAPCPAGPRGIAGHRPTPAPRRCGAPAP